MTADGLAGAIPEGLLVLAGRLLATIPEGLGAFLAVGVVLGLLRVRDARLRGAAWTAAFLDTLLPLCGGGWCAALRVEFIAGPGPLEAGRVTGFAAGLRALAAAGAALWVAVALLRVAGTIRRVARGEQFARELRALARPGSAVVTADGDGVPFVAGVLRPVVVLPRAFLARLTPRERRAALRHEIAHVRRRDTLRAALLGVLGDVLWFHPLAPALLGRIAAERESATDDRAVRRGAEPADLGGAIAAAFSGMRTADLRAGACLWRPAPGDPRPALDGDSCEGRGHDRGSARLVEPGLETAPLSDAARRREATRVARRIARLSAPARPAVVVLHAVLLLGLLPFAPGAGRSAVDLTSAAPAGRIALGLGWCSGPAFRVLR